MRGTIEISPSDAIRKTGFAQIRVFYEQKCSPVRITIEEEFRQYQKASNLKSQERFGALVGLSRGQVQRILRGQGLPQPEQLEAARSKLRNLYGEPDQSAIRRIKREKTIRTLLPAIGIEATCLGKQAIRFSSARVEVLSRKLPIPDHATLSAREPYSDWLHEQACRHNARVDDVNAVGHFFAVRERLNGFVSRLFDDAHLLKSLAENEACADAETLFTAMTGIVLTLDAFRAHSNDVAMVRRDLSNLFQIRQVANDDDIVREFLRTWDLSIDHFCDPEASAAYLAMESKSLRKCAISVLSQSDAA